MSGFFPQTEHLKTFRLFFLRLYCKEFPYTKHLQNLKQQVTERRIPLPGTYLVICGQSEMKNKTES